MIRGETIRLAWLARITISVVVCASAEIAAQDVYPSKSIRLIVPYGAGSGPDGTARRIAPKLSASLGQPVLVDNRPGSGGIIGTDTAAKAPADGYTIVLGAIGTLAVGDLYPKLPYDPVRSFAPVALVLVAPYGLYVSPDSAARTLEQVIALARARPGALTFASQGNGSASHLAGELFKQIANVDLRHIPYKEFGQGINDLIGGHVDIFFDAVAPLRAHLKAGTIRGLATSAASRSSAAPELPTFIEAGLPDYDMKVWLGILAPSQTPAPAIAKLNAAVNAAIVAPDLKEFAVQTNTLYMGGTPEQFATFIDAEITKWRRVIKGANIRLE